MLRIALAGIGKIARDQHVPRSPPRPTGSWRRPSRATGRWRASRPSPTSTPSSPRGPTWRWSRSACRRSRATPTPRPRCGPGATSCSRSRRGQTLAEVHALMRLAEAQGVTLFATWHSPHGQGRRGRQGLARRQDRHRRPHHLARGRPQVASGPGVGLGARRPRRLRSRHQRAVDPDRDPARAHPPDRRRPRRARGPRHAHRRPPDLRQRLTADFDWRQEGPQTWDIDHRDRRGHAVACARAAAGSSPTGSRRPPTASRSPTSTRRSTPAWPTWCARGPPTWTSRRWSTSPTPSASAGGTSWSPSRSEPSAARGRETGGEGVAHGRGRPPDEGGERRVGPPELAGPARPVEAEDALGGPRGAPRSCIAWLSAASAITVRRTGRPRISAASAARPSRSSASAAVSGGVGPSGRPSSPG